jgi:hypothetical protein
MVEPKSEAKKPPLQDFGHAPMAWASELASIEVQGPVTILTFAEMRREGLSDAYRQICARVANPHVAPLTDRRPHRGLEEPGGGLGEPDRNCLSPAAGRRRVGGPGA